MKRVEQKLGWIPKDSAASRLRDFISLRAGWMLFIKTDWSTNATLPGVEFMKSNSFIVSRPQNDTLERP